MALVECGLYGASQRRLLLPPATLPTETVVTHLGWVSFLPATLLERQRIPEIRTNMRVSFCSCSMACPGPWLRVQRGVLGHCWLDSGVAVEEPLPMA